MPSRNPWANTTSGNGPGPGGTHTVVGKVRVAATNVPPDVMVGRDPSTRSRLVRTTAGFGSVAVAVPVAVPATGPVAVTDVGAGGAAGSVRPDEPVDEQPRATRPTATRAPRAV